LRSSWFSVGWLDLDPPATPVPLGTTVTLTGIASGLGTVELEDRVPGSAWQTAESILPARAGSFSVSVTPAQTTSYRLLAGGASGAVVEIRVAAVVSASRGASGITGTVDPAAAGEAVQLQRAAAAGWTTIATASTGTGGAYRFAPQAEAATYRVEVDPGGGLLAGVSASLEPSG
jgi:hypothetical protein